MTKKITFYLFAGCTCLLLTFQVNGQDKYTVNNQWTDGGSADFEYAGVFDSTAALTHGIVVDRFNRVWIGSFSASAPGIIIRNPDGTEAPFSPIDTISFAGTDYDVHSNCRGMTLDQDGNVLYATSAALYRIDVETGEGQAIWESTKAALTKPAVDRDGYVYVGDVVGLNPITVLEPIFFSETAQYTLNPVAGLARGLEITSDARHLWTGNLTAGGPVYHYTTEDFITYDIADSLFLDISGANIFNFALTTMDWGPDSTLWVSQETEAPDLQSQNSLVIFDFNANEFTTLLMPPVDLGSYNGPRGVAFSTSGDTAYVASFNGSRVWKYERMGTTFVDEGDVASPQEFALMQNYPNPFNPSTSIQFSLPPGQSVSLFIYNSLGQEVRTMMVNLPLKEGTHRVTWDATDNNGSPVSSGVYIYKLLIGNFSKSRTMMLVR